MNNSDYIQKAEALIKTGKAAHRQGWVPATSGNFSARMDENTMAITVSGAHKGEMTLDDIMLADMDGVSLQAEKQPSAETGLHAQLYRRLPRTGAVLHTHSMNATLLSRIFNHQIILENYELLKAFEGIGTHESDITVPIFANDQDINRLAGRVDRYMDSHAVVYGYLIAGHGLYTWGADIRTAMTYLEAFEYLFSCELKLHEVKR